MSSATKFSTDLVSPQKRFSVNVIAILQGRLLSLTFCLNCLD